MKNIKQVIVVRKDLKLRKSKLISLAAVVANKFLTENNEAQRHDELYVKLSQEEVEWLRGTTIPIILGIDSQHAISNLVFQAELLGVSVHIITDPMAKPEDDHTILCAALGPDEEELINKITNNLKSI